MTTETKAEIPASPVSALSPHATLAVRSTTDPNITFHTPPPDTNLKMPLRSRP